MIVFRDPWVLLMIPVLIMLFVIVRVSQKETSFIFPSDSIIKFLPGSARVGIVRKLIYLRLLALSLVCVALAGPQITRESTVRREGIAIILAIDCSSTMLARDLQMGFEDMARYRSFSDRKLISRIEGVKAVAEDFIGSREDDLVGIVAFAADAYVLCPLTFDHKWLLKAVERIRVGMIKDGTAIGSGILSGLNSLKDIEARSKIIILLTDGINNYGRVPPEVAAQAARAIGVKIYTVGLVSSPGLYDTGDSSGRKVYRDLRIAIDEEELEKMATVTGGEYLRATDMSTLRQSYETIDKLEKVRMERKGLEEYVDIFQPFLAVALMLIVADILLANTVLRKIP